MRPKTLYTSCRGRSASTANWVAFSANHPCNGWSAEKATRLPYLYQFLFISIFRTALNQGPFLVSVRKSNILPRVVPSHYSRLSMYSQSSYCCCRADNWQSQTLDGTVAEGKEKEKYVWRMHQPPQTTRYQLFPSISQEKLTITTTIGRKSPELDPALAIAMATIGLALRAFEG